jgi:hypothetical protein
MAATQTAFIQEGRILQIGPTDSVFRDLTAELRAYLGDVVLEKAPVKVRAR